MGLILVLVRPGQSRTPAVMPVSVSLHMSGKAQPMAEKRCKPEREVEGHQPPLPLTPLNLGHGQFCQGSGSCSRKEVMHETGS